MDFERKLQEKQHRCLRDYMSTIPNHPSVHPSRPFLHEDEVVRAMQKYFQSPRLVNFLFESEERYNTPGVQNVLLALLSSYLQRQHLDTGNIPWKNFLQRGDQRGEENKNPPYDTDPNLFRLMEIISLWYASLSPINGRPSSFDPNKFFWDLLHRPELRELLKNSVAHIDEKETENLMKQLWTVYFEEEKRKRPTSSIDTTAIQLFRRHLGAPYAYLQFDSDPTFEDPEKVQSLIDWIVEESQKEFADKKVPDEVREKCRRYSHELSSPMGAPPTTLEKWNKLHCDWISGFERAPCMQELTSHFLYRPGGIGFQQAGKRYLQSKTKRKRIQ